MSNEHLFQFDKSLPFASFVNSIIASVQRLPLRSTYSGILQSYPSDQLAGQMTPGTSIPYNKTTECQSLILEWYEKQTMAGATQGALPDDLQEVLEKNAGPAAVWNYSYEQWGVVSGVSPAFKTLTTVEVGTAREVTVIVP